MDHARAGLIFVLLGFGLSHVAGCGALPGSRAGYAHEASPALGPAASKGVEVAVDATLRADQDLRLEGSVRMVSSGPIPILAVEGLVRSADGADAGKLIRNAAPPAAPASQSAPGMPSLSSSSWKESGGRTLTAQGRSAPTITITRVPRLGAGPDEMDTIAGETRGADASRHRVVIFSRTDQWYVQPYVSSPFTTISRDGSWLTTIHLGREYAAILVGVSYRPPATTLTLPTVGDGVLAIAQAAAASPKK